MLSLSNVHVTFNAGTPSEVRALRGLSLNVAEGDFVTVIGANGAGKSTLFNVIAGTVSAERGKIIAEAEVTGMLELLAEVERFPLPGSAA